MVKLGFILIFGVIAAGSLVYGLTSSIKEKVNMITAYLHDIGRGDFTSDRSVMAVVDDLTMISRDVYHMKESLADIIREIEGDSGDKSFVAWRIFLKGYERHGFWESIRFPDPAYHYAIEMMGGWMRLCEELNQLQTSRDLEFRSKDWRRLYEIGLTKATWGDEPGKIKVPAYCTGYHEWNNMSGGFLEFIPPVLEIGTGQRIYQDALGQGSKVKGLQSASIIEEVPSYGERKTEKDYIRIEGEEGASRRSGEGIVHVSAIQSQAGSGGEEGENLEE